MKRLTTGRLIAGGLTISLLCGSLLLGQPVAAEPNAAGHTDLLTSGKQVQWGPAPPLIPSGAQAAVLAGDPLKPGSPYTLRLRMPAGYRVAPHFHPSDENVTVLSGALGVGMGEQFDKAKGQVLGTGGFVSVPHGMHHYAWAASRGP